PRTQQETEIMHPGGSGRLYRRSRGAMRLRCRIQGFRPRLRVFCVGEKMKKAYNRLLASAVSTGKSTIKSLLGCNGSNPSVSAARPLYGRSNSFYAEAIAD
ncbi:hypothetical protein KI387_013972, partial [Taxus chinensis]